MKFFHVADAHLDSPFLGLSALPKNEFVQIQQSTNVAFKKIIDQALAQKIDFLLLVGDTFDNPQPAPATQVFFQAQIQRLAEAKIPTFMLFGNHDYFTSNGYIFKESKFLHLFQADVEQQTLQTADGITVDINGFSYYQNHDPKDHVPEYPEKQSGHYTIGMLHGAIKTHSAADQYAPFELAEIIAKNYDYFALGHIHKRAVLSEQPLVAYAGNIQGRHINEPGLKGYYEVDVDRDSLHSVSRFVPVSPIVWQRLTLTVNDHEDYQAFKSSLTTMVNEQNIQHRTLVDLTVRHAERLSPADLSRLEDKSIMADLSANLPLSSFIVRLHLTAGEEMNFSEVDQAYFTQSAQIVFQAEELLTTGKTLSQKYEFIAEHLQTPELPDQIQAMSKLVIDGRIKGETE